MDQSRRTDYASSRPLALGTKATASQLEDTERVLGFSLHDLHKRVLVEVGNGGFGPGDGIIGIAGGVPDACGRHLLALRDQIWLDADTPLPRPVVPVCDWGDGIWSCLDSAAGQVLTLDEAGLKYTGQSLDEWLWAWSEGESLWDRTVVLEERELLDPFTKQARVVKVVTGTRGVPYIPRDQRVYA